MKLRIHYVSLLLLVCCSVQLKMHAQYYGIENNGNGSYTIWMNGGSVTTNTQGQYSVSNNQGTYCMGCYAQPQYGNTTYQYYSPTYTYQALAGTPPSNYSSTMVIGNYQNYYNASGGLIAQIPFGVNTNVSQGIVGYNEGCVSCAQQQASNQAANQWNPTAVSMFQSQSYGMQQVTLANMQQQMNDAYNAGNIYNYYYFFYAYAQVTNTVGTSTPLPISTPMTIFPGTPEETLPTNNNPALLPAELGGNRTYVTPAGTPIILPPGAQVGSLLLDRDNFTNGALFSFYVNGKRYMALESYYDFNFGGSGGEPTFHGYYEVGPDGRCDRTKPYPFTPSDYPPTNQGPINVIRLRDQDGPPCKIVQEIVSYTTPPNTPATSPGQGDYGQMQHDDIEYSDIVPNAPTNQVGTGCPNAGNGNINNSGPLLDKWVNNNPQGGASRFSGFLQVFMTKNTVKLYLYDCGTGKAKYTVTKEGISTLTPAQADAETDKFNNGNFGTGDQDIAVKGCIGADGKWQVSTKFNKSKLTPDPRVAPTVNGVVDQTKLNAAIDAIEQEAQEEIKKLRTPNMRSNTERFDVGNGEEFSKMGMDIFEAISAIYDVGREIINTGAMPEKIWDGGKRANGVTLSPQAQDHSKSVFKMPTVISGGTDELIDQLTGVVQLIKAGYQFMRHPIQTGQNIWNSVKTLNGDKILSMIGAATGASNVIAGGDRLKYQAGKYTVMAATIFIAQLKTINQGTKLVEGAGNELSDIQKFIPDGGSNHSVADALQNASTNNKLVKNLEGEVLMTKNVLVNGEERLIAIDKVGGDIFDSKALNNMEEITDDVLKKADAGDIAEAAEDGIIHTEMKTQPQRFKDGKTFEKNVTNDPAHVGKVEAATNLSLSGYTKGEQVQIKMADGSYIVADNVYYKPVPGTTNEFDVIINETKLSSAAPFSTNQNKFLTELGGGTTNFELRTSKFEASAIPMPKNAVLHVKAFVKSVGDGTTGIGNYTVTKIP